MARKPTPQRDEDRALGTLNEARKDARPAWLTSAALDMITRALASPRIDPTLFGFHLSYELPDADTPAGWDLIMRGVAEVVDGRALLTIAGVIAANLWREG